MNKKKLKNDITDNVINDQNTVSKYVIRLQENGKTQFSYRISKELFDAIKKEVAPYRSLQAQPKKIKCVETGRIFRCAREAVDWLYEMNLTENYSADISIKAACKGQKTKAYGYHWEFVK